MDKVFNKKDYDELLEREKRHIREKGRVQKQWDYSEEELAENENWLDVMMPYSDLVTLLLVFFIFFYIFNTFSQHPSKSSGTIFEKQRKAKSSAEMIDSNRVVIDKEKLKVLKEAEEDTLGGMKEYVFTVSGGVLFESGSAELKWSAESTLRLIAMEIQNKIKEDPHWQIRIEGHTDNGLW